MPGKTDSTAQAGRADPMIRCAWLALAAAVGALSLSAPALAAVSENLLGNASFEEGLDPKGVPLGWGLYGGAGTGQRIGLIEAGRAGGNAVLIEDGDPTAEIGLMQTVPARAGLTYEVSAMVRGVPNASSHGAYLQLRFLPSGKLVQHSLAAGSEEDFEEIAVKATAPAGTRAARIYIYTHRAPTPKLVVDNVVLVSGVPPPPPAPPEPIPPVYTKLKELHLTTALVEAGKPAATIVAPASGLYDDQAAGVQRAVQELAGVKLPLISDEAPEAGVPISGNLIVLGNRSTNKAISELYNRFYTLLDLRYPGAGGHVLRTLHDPFGNGHNVIFVGGSDRTGVEAASEALVSKLRQAGARPGSLTIGRLAEIRLGQGIEVPKDVREFETWEASAGYGSVGYFGWNSISKHMAMYYMTGDESHAREFLRLAFPDAEARRQIAEIDGERIENKEEPLSGPYHYTAHMMILFWDLIEESPVFTDQDRLRVTNAFAKQLNHRKGEGIYRLTEPPRAVGSRHGQWSAISLYCLGRYFQRHYPHPIWQHCMDSGRLHFAPLHEHAWVGGESDNLFWYNTGIAPILTYLVLTGDREPIRNGVLRRLLFGLEMLISGRQPDWALRSASIGLLHKAAYLMQDGRYLLYRDRTGVDTGVFRLGQSFWPEEHLAPELPDDLVGKWSINYLPKPMWRARHNGFKLEESFMFGSFRSAADASGDFVLIDGYNGASRNPYHTFAVLELRLGGHCLLRGYRNQVVTRAEGMVEPTIAMDAALRHVEVLGDSAVAVAAVPNAAYCNWRRTLLQRIGRYALVVDDLAFRTDSDNVEVAIKWETERAPKTFDDGHVELEAPIEVGERRNVRGGQIWPCDLMSTTRSGRVCTMRWLGPVERGQHRVFFSLLGVQPGAQTGSMRCLRLAPNAAALALPAPALAVVGRYETVDAELLVLADDHLCGRQVTRAELGGTLLVSDAPVDVDWDFESGALHPAAGQDTRLRLALAAADQVRWGGEAAVLGRDEDGLATLELSAGRHVLAGAKPDASVQRRATTRLSALLAQAGGERARLAAARAPAQPTAPPLTRTMTANVGGRVVDVAVAGSDEGALICAAEGNDVHVLGPDGKELRRLAADGEVRMVHWWPQHELLLVGCADEQVIAFGVDGERRWAFTSEMDPAVFRAAKTYWFKSAPGHEGIHGLHTEVFLNGESQAFVGSACTLEILDAEGKLVKRLPQFWGDVSTFAMVPGPEGSLNLLAARKYNGTNTVAIINNETLDPRPRGFHTVPAGHTYVGGWSSMNRHHLFYDDLDGDGTGEVVSEINGTWNRVTVWDVKGKALYDASFGPGERIPAKNMRDLDIADLDGDGTKEIVAATSSGLVVALDHQCRKVWATRLSSPPTVMKYVRPEGERTAWIVVGCEDGSVPVLDGDGQLIRLGQVDGAPTCIEALAAAAGGPVVLLATAAGEVAGFKVGD